MVSGVRSHLQHNVVGYVALFVALGGTSYAALKLPASSVGAKQIRSGAVTEKKLARSAVTDRVVRRGSLRASAFAPGQLVAGAAGPQGSPGQQGPVGPAGAPGAAGGAGATGATGPSDAYVASLAPLLDPSTGITLAVPAGTYVVTARASVTNFGVGAALAECDLSPSDDAGGSTDLTDTTVAPGYNASIFSMATKTLATAGTFNFRCSPGPSYGRAKLVAIKVGALHRAL
jgi:hypothetical protein